MRNGRFESRPHWVSAYKGLLGFALAIVLLGLSGIVTGASAQMLLFLSAVSTFLGALQLLVIGTWILTTRYILSDEGVSWKSGWLWRRRQTEMPYHSIVRIDAVESPVGRVFDYGLVRIHGIGGSAVSLQDVRSFARFYRELEARKAQAWASGKSSEEEPV